MTLRVVGTRKRVDGRSKRQKLAAVLAAEASGVVEAARATGIPHQTISYWMNDPRFSEIRRKAREDLAEEYKIAAHLTVARVVELVDSMEPRDAIFAMEKAATLLQLLTGQATERTEHRELLTDFDDHEREAMSEWLRSVVRERLGAGDSA